MPETTKAGGRRMPAGPAAAAGGQPTTTGGAEAPAGAGDRPRTKPPRTTWNAGGNTGARRPSTYPDHGDAVALARATAGMVADYVRDKGVRKVSETAAETAVRLMRSKGYAVTEVDGGYMVDKIFVPSSSISSYAAVRVEMA